MKRVDGGVTAGKYQKFRVFNKILGDIKMKKPKDKDRAISRIACVNSSIKFIEAINLQSKDIKKDMFQLAEDIFEFINK